MLILPYIEQKPLHDSLDFNIEFNSYSNLGTQTINTQKCEVPVAAFRCPSYAPPPHRWVLPTAVARTDAHYAKFVNNYYACMGGGPIMTGSDVNTDDGCYSPNVPGGSIAQFTNGLIGVNTKNGFRHCTDGTSNVVMLGESAYQGIELLRGWFNGMRVGHHRRPISRRAISPARPACPTAASGTTSIFKALTTSNLNIHNALNTLYFGSQHPGGCQIRDGRRLGPVPQREHQPGAVSAAGRDGRRTAGRRILAVAVTVSIEGTQFACRLSLGARRRSALAVWLRCAAGRLRRRWHHAAPGVAAT